LISGVAWDINVFQLIKYVEQFEIFLLAGLVNGGILVYNESDPEIETMLPKLLTNPIPEITMQHA
jgi:hypothetical protein